MREEKRRGCSQDSAAAGGLSLLQHDRLVRSVGERVGVSVLARRERDRPNSCLSRSLQNGFEIGVPGREREHVDPAGVDVTVTAHTAADRCRRVDGEPHVDVAAGHDDFEPSGFRGLDEARGRVFVEVTPRDGERAVGGPSLADVVQVDGEVLSQDVRTVDEQADPRFAVRRARGSGFGGTAGLVVESEQAAEPSHDRICAWVVNSGVDARPIVGTVAAVAGGVGDAAPDAMPGFHTADEKTLPHSDGPFSMTERTPPLHDEHRGADAEFTDFGGWSMPVEFAGIRAEHEAVRDAVGRFDVSHMSQLVVSGPDATELMDRLTTNDVASLEVGDAQYAAITDERGVMLDDTVVYRLPDRRAQPTYRFVPNAGHDEQMVERWQHHRDQWGLAAEVDDRTGEDAMLAIQGPEALDTMAEIGEDVSDLGRFEARWADVAGVECWVARTGYTGEDGVELICPAATVSTVWSAMDCQRCGLGARDTLRLEAGLLLSGEDFDAEDNPRTPYEADLDFIVDFGSEFVGLDALAEQAEEGVAERIVGFQLEERGVPRHGYTIETPDGEAIGEVTSGTMSPTLDEAIGLGYVPVDYVEPGTELRVVVRDDPKAATVRELPFLE